MAQEQICPNCGSELGTNYCENCGQRSALPSLTFKEIFVDFLSSVFNTDAPLPRTVIGLFTNPGSLIRNYLIGKRKSYYAPVKYVVFCFFVNILMSELVGFDPIENQQLIDGRSEVEASQNAGYEVGRFLSEYLNYFIFLFPFSMAVFSKVFFWRNPQRFAERTVFGFFVAGQYLLISMIPVLLTTFNPKFVYLIYALGISYMTFAYFGMYGNQRPFLGIFKSILASIFALIFYFMAAAVLAALILEFF